MIKLRGSVENTFNKIILSKIFFFSIICLLSLPKIVFNTYLFKHI